MGGSGIGVPVTQIPTTSSIDTDSLKELIKIQLTSLSALITDDGYSLVVNQTTQELGWSLPATVTSKIFWFVKRGTRHALYLLLISSAYKFKYKQINLQQRFEHFKALIDTMDEEFEKAMAADVALFADVDSYKMFGTKIDAGFAYDSIGNDITYDLYNYVNFAPLEE